MSWSARKSTPSCITAITTAATIPITTARSMRRFRDGAVHNVDNEVFWRKDGSPVWVEYTSTPIRDRHVVVGAVIVFRDVSQRREADEKLHAALAEVDRLRERLELENAYLQEKSASRPIRAASSARARRSRRRCGRSSWSRRPRPR